MTAKFRDMSDSLINKMFVVIGGVCIAVVLLLPGLASANIISSTIFFATIFASLTVLTGLFYALYKVSKRSRFMFS